MPQYLAPDVYVEEIDSGNKPIEGVSTSFTGFVGMTQRGPSKGLPQLVTSYSQFKSIYGSYFDFGPGFATSSDFAGYNSLPFAVDGFFTNLGSVAYISRVLPTGAASATTTATGGLITRLTQDAQGGQANIVPATLRGIEKGTNLLLRMVKNGIPFDSATMTVLSINRATGVVTLTANLAAGVWEARYTTVFTDTSGVNPATGAITTLSTVVPPWPTIARPNTFTITAANEGTWGNSIAINASHESAARAQLDTFVSGAAGNNQIQLKSTANFYVNAWVEIDRGNTKHYRKCLAINGSVITLDGPAMAAGDVAPELAAPDNITYFSTTEFRLVVSFNGQTEQYGGLTLENVPGRYYFDRINNVSQLIQVGAPPAAPDHTFLFPSGPDGLQIPLLNGNDGTAAPGDADYIGQDNGPGKRTGIQALLDIDSLSIVAVPGITSQGVQSALITHCENMRFRFAILDPALKAFNPEVSGDINDIQNQRDQYDTKYAAIYYPRIVIDNLLTNTNKALAPSGHIAGIYARVDDQRGVFKAPANEILGGAVDLEIIVNKAEQEILNPEPNNINVNRDFRHAGRGLRVWGARCITSDPDWKYINVRRLFIFIEKSIEQGTQWAVFEPNDYKLWARVSQSVSAFLTRVWRDGGLMGQKPEQAFFVKCDQTTMTQDDIDNGRLIMLVGIAPVKPAEFVIIRIGQWAGGSMVQEL
jgi:phage tail sheath protein FI